MKRNPNFVSRSVAGELVLVPIAHEAADLESVFTLNEVAARAWDLVDECEDMPGIARKLTEEYDVDYETALSDVEELFTQLQELNAIIND